MDYKMIIARVENLTPEEIAYWKSKYDEVTSSPKEDPHAVYLDEVTKELLNLGVDISDCTLVDSTRSNMIEGYNYVSAKPDYFGGRAYIVETNIETAWVFNKLVMNTHKGYQELLQEPWLSKEAINEALLYELSQLAKARVKRDESN